MADITYIHEHPKPTGKEKVDPASSVMIGHGNLQCRKAVEKTGWFVAGRRAEINSMDHEIAETLQEHSKVENELLQKCGGNEHVAPFSIWVQAVVFVVGLIAEFVIGDSLLDYAFIQGRPPGSPKFLEHFEGVGVFEGLLYAVTDYSTQKEWAAIGIAVFMFISAAITGIWVRQRASGRSQIPKWGVITVNAVILAACVGYVLLRHAMMQATPDSEPFAYLAPVFLAIQTFFYAIACLWAAANADPDPLAAGFAKRKVFAKAKLSKLLAKRARISSEVTSAIVGTIRKCDEIAAKTLWDIAAYRHANLRYRDPNEEAPDFLTAPINPAVFEPIYLDPVPDLPAKTMEAILKVTGTR